MLLYYMNFALYMIYSKSKNGKDIWDALNAKYGCNDFGTKKYASSRWLKSIMSDDKHARPRRRPTRFRGGD